MYDPINYKKRRGYENITHQFSLNQHRPPQIVYMCTVIARYLNTNLNQLRWYNSVAMFNKERAMKLIFDTNENTMPF
jgi:hypothetical protein